MSELKPIKKWNICFRMDKTSVKVIENINPITDLNYAIKKCKELRTKFSDRIWFIELNKID